MNILRRSVFILCIVTILGASEPVYPQGVEFSFHGGQAMEDYKNGVGASINLNIPTGIKTIHAGGRAIYHFPTSTNDRDISLLLYGVDLGFTLLSSPIFIRAKGGLGRAQVSESLVILDDQIRTEITRTTDTYYVQPSINFIFSLGIAFVGIEGTYIRIDEGPNTMAVYGTVGFKVGR